MPHLEIYPVASDLDTGHTHRRERTPYDYPAKEPIEKIRSPAEDRAAKVRAPELSEGVSASESIANDDPAWRKYLY